MYKNQQADVYQNQNQHGEMYQKQQTSTYQNQQTGTYQIQQIGEYQVQQNGMYQNQQTSAYQDKQSIPYQNQLGASLSHFDQDSTTGQSALPMDSASSTQMDHSVNEDQLLPPDWSTLSTAQQNAKVMTSILSNGNQLSFLNQQFTQLNTQLSAHNELLKQHSTDIATLTDQVQNLNAQTQLIRSDFEELKSVNSYNTCTSEILVSGIPNYLDNISFDDLTRKILLYLDIPHLMNDILSYRPFNVQNHINQAQNDPPPITFFFVIKFKSNFVKDYVLEIKAAAENLKVQLVFPEVTDPAFDAKNVILRDLLSAPIYKLKRQALERVKNSVNYKQVVIRNGRVFVRKDKQSEHIPIITDSDLSKIN